VEELVDGLVDGFLRGLEIKPGGQMVDIPETDGDNKHRFGGDGRGGKQRDELSDLRGQVWEGPRGVGCGREHRMGGCG